jgi:hypothetical protein
MTSQAQTKRPLETTSEEPQAEKKLCAEDNIFIQAWEELKQESVEEAKKYAQAQQVAREVLENLSGPRLEVIEWAITKCSGAGSIEDTLSSLKSLVDEELKPQTNFKWYEIQKRVTLLIAKAIPDSSFGVGNMLRGSAVSEAKKRLKTMTQDPKWLKIIHNLLSLEKEAKKVILRD